MKKDTYSYIPRSYTPQNLFRQVQVSLFTACITFVSGNTLAATSSDFASQPAVITQTATPLVMLNMSNDHQLYYKAYTDYDDLDSDGSLDTTYDDTISYYGYFDPLKCYTYSIAASGSYSPSALATGANNHHCTAAADDWSGNFLNWATMSRMDVLRKVLYGGKRSTDTTTNTVLERAYIPNDNHAWSKYVSIANIGTLENYTPYTNAGYPAGITMCNVTPGGSGADNLSETNTITPRFRVAKGEWANWAAQESKQCLWDNDFASVDNPNYLFVTEVAGEYTVRVTVCDSSLLGSESCKTYNDSGTPRYKPVGLLQTYAESDSIHFGLLTGSYANGKSGGVLRKNISGITDEINQTNGKLISGANGIIETLDRLRISRYKYSDPGYGDAAVDNCPFNQNSWNNGECANWGNPVGEMFLETLRYYAGATANFSSVDSTWISGLTEATWKDPYDTIAGGGLGYAQCSKPNIINFSTGLLSFDDDEYAGASDLTGLTVNTITDTVGTEEGITGNDYYVGSIVGGSPNDTCTSTTVSNLSSVTGLCPEAAGLEGSYKIAGLAYHARTNDISSTATGSQTVNTFSVSLSPPIPELDVDVGGNTVTIIPVGYNWRDSNAMVLVNFQVISQTATTGEFFMNYENAPAGADHDSDFKGYLKYEVVGGNISIVTTNTGSSAGSTMHMGYIIDGVSDAGTFHMASNQDVDDVAQTAGGTYTETKTDVDADCPAIVYPASGARTICTSTAGLASAGAGRDMRGIRTHTAAASTTNLLENPLWYAAKYGGFKDSDANSQPNLVSEWDAEINATGASGTDGIPDNYYLVTNPANLESKLRTTFNEIIERVSSGTAAAVVSNNSSGEGAIYQALYQPLIKSGLDDVTWTGDLQSIFIDNNGYFREDSDLDNRLDDYTTDYRIIYSYDSVDDETLIQRQSSADGGTTFTDEGSAVPIANLKTIWNAKDQLEALSQAGITSNRTYTDDAGDGRYITTWIDADGDSVVDASEHVAFESSTICNYGGAACAVNNYGYLDVLAAEADDIVDFIRGKEGISGYRSRSFDTNSDGTADDFYLLGDIIHSTPVVVGAPSSAYDIYFSDETYKTFVNTYSDRRQVVYVGTNDGMIHAFNAGFWDAANKEFGETSGTRTAHTLGAELWAYVPMNLLPHLQWLKELNYPHVYYMDGPPVSFDARIFTDDTTHPGGWGTVLVIGMRLGGGDIAIDTDSDGTDDKTTRSSYVVLDITDPESAPVLIDEITNSNLGFTTSQPTLVKKRAPDAGGDWSSPTQDDWYLVFGSGPTTLTDVTSAQQARLYIYDLETNAFVAGFDGTANITTTANSLTSFAGDMAAVDWDNDYIDDAVYFGTVGGTVAAPTGSLQRLKLSDNSVNKLLEPTTGAFRSQPSLAVDEDSDRWIYAGSGRLFVTSDASQSTQDALYGVKEPLSSGVFTWGTVTTGTLQEVTDVRTFVDGSITDPSGVLPSGADPSGGDLDSFKELQQYIEDNKSGWFRNFPLNGTDPSTRNLTASIQVSSILFFTDYTPAADACDVEGSSKLYGVDYKTGIADPSATFGSDSSIQNNGEDWAPDSVDLGAGLASAPVVHTSSPGGTTIITNKSTGDPQGEDVTLPPWPTGRQTWREIDLY